MARIPSLAGRGAFGGQPEDCHIAAQLEITVDYLIAEFYDDGELIVPDYVEE